jgi:hypothetical protein
MTRTRGSIEMASIASYDTVVREFQNANPHVNHPFARDQGWMAFLDRALLEYATRNNMTPDTFREAFAATAVAFNDRGTAVRDPMAFFYRNFKNNFFSARKDKQQIAKKEEESMYTVQHTPPLDAPLYTPTIHSTYETARLVLSGDLDGLAEAHGSARGWELVIQDLSESVIDHKSTLDIETYSPSVRRGYVDARACLRERGLVFFVEEWKRKQAVLQFVAMVQDHVRTCFS